MINYKVMNLGIFIKVACIHVLIAMVVLFSIQSHSDSTSTESTASSASDSIYEECTYENDDYTKRIVENAISPIEGLEACEDCLTKQIAKSITDNLNNVLQIAKNLNQIPSICFLMSSVRSIEKKGGKGSKNYYYCSKPTDKMKSSTKKVETNDGKKRDIWPRRPCLTENYVDMTAHAFNYMANCFGYSSLNEKKNLFALFNHESSFILNNRSQTGARCYGQLTGDTITEVERRIAINESYNTGPFDDSKFIYTKALQRCPDLNSKLVIDPRILQTIDDDKKLATSALNKIQNQKKMGSNTCRTTQHPYTCLFYSMYNYKLNELAMNDVLNAVPEIPENASEKIKKDFDLPIKPLEIITVKGTLRKKNGKIRTVDWVLRDDQEVVTEMSAFDYDLKDVKIKKIALYKENNIISIKSHVILTSYNGGISVPINMFKYFIKQKKERMSYSSTCKKYPKSDHCKYRKKILNNQSLSYEDFSESFYDYIEEKYKGRLKRRREVANFYRHIVKNMGYLRNEGGFLSQHLKQLKGNENESSSKDIDEMIKSAGKVCPFTPYKSPDL